jgi:hypothetical protein
LTAPEVVMIWAFLRALSSEPDTVSRRASGGRLQTWADDDADDWSTAV